MELLITLVVVKMITAGKENYDKATQHLRDLL